MTRARIGGWGAAEGSRLAWPARMPDGKGGRSMWHARSFSSLFLVVGLALTTAVGARGQDTTPMALGLSGIQPDHPRVAMPALRISLHRIAPAEASGPANGDRPGTSRPRIIIGLGAFQARPIEAPLTTSYPAFVWALQHRGSLYLVPYYERSQGLDLVFATLMTSR